MLAGEGLAEPHGDQLLDQGDRQGLADVEAQCARRGCVALELVPELGEDGAAVRQVAEVGLERGEAGDRLSAHLEGREAIGHPLLGLGEDVKYRLAQLGERFALGLIQAIQVLVDLLSGHRSIVPASRSGGQGGCRAIALVAAGPLR